MLPRIIEDITIADLEKLIEDQEQEGTHIEYKSESYRLDAPDGEFKVKQHEELLKDVSSFGNEAGGDLILGMKEASGIPTELCGIETDDPDALKLRLTEIIQKWLEPRLSSSIHFVRIAEERFAFIVRMNRSLLAPHRVVYQSRFGQFWGRNSSGAYMMDTTQLRRAFTLSETIHDRIKAFRRERVETISAGVTPALLTDGAKLILHLVPIESFAARLSFAPSDLQRLTMHLAPLASNSGHTPRFNIDGIVTSDFSDFRQPSFGYVQLYRNGIIEVGASDLTYQEPTDPEKRQWFRTNYEHYLRERLPNYLRCQESLGIPPPIWVFLTLIGVKDVGIHRDRQQPRPPIDRFNLLLPEVEIAALPIEPLAIMRPLFDMIWNAAGFSQSLSFNSKGEFVATN